MAGVSKKESRCVEKKDDTTSNEKTNQVDSRSSEETDAKSELFTIRANIDLISILLLIVGLCTRLWKLEQPRSIVFDELHYGRYAALYVKQTFFFDCHPPLGKQLLALAGYLAGFDGNFKFDRIGSPYTGCIPVWALRIIPALCGSFLIPTTYHILRELGSRRWTAIGAAVLILLDNSMLTQSRFALMESIFLQFSAFGIICLLKFRKHNARRKFSTLWFTWLLMMSVSLTCALCVKYIGFFTMCLAGAVLMWDYWNDLKDKNLTDRTMFGYFLVYVIALVVLPVILYLLTFYAHLSILNKAGPHDSVMTSAFQASLEGGLASITKGQPHEVVHGSQITLRHTHGRPCWLHSHANVYPIRYADGRGSSHQQQVTCYSFKDVNNWWIIKRPNRNDLVVSEPLDKIKHGDVIQLIHGMSSRALNSHDVAAPSSPQNQEVSCYIDYNVSMPAQNMWRVDIINRETAGDVWHAIQSQVHLVHLNTTQALKFSGRQLPDWGYHQHEVVTDRVIAQENTVWNVEEHRYTKNADQKDRERELGMAEFVPTEPTKLSFWSKFWELQIKMFMIDQENVQDHLYSSEPYEWPLLTRGVAYWISANSNAQIHLLGNIAIWYAATGSLLLYLTLLTFYMLRRQRMCFDLPQDTWDGFIKSGQILFLGYLLHYLPYFCVERTLFLHHYLPAFYYKLLLTAVMMEHLSSVVMFNMGTTYKRVLQVCILLWFVVVAYVYKRFTVLSYGHDQLGMQEVVNLRWKPTWDFIIHRP